MPIVIKVNVPTGTQFTAEIPLELVGVTDIDGNNRAEVHDKVAELTSKTIAAIYKATTTSCSSGNGHGEEDVQITEDEQRDEADQNSEHPSHLATPAADDHVVPGAHAMEEQASLSMEDRVTITLVDEAGPSESSYNIRRQCHVHDALEAFAKADGRPVEELLMLYDEIRTYATDTAMSLNIPDNARYTVRQAIRPSLHSNAPPGSESICTRTARIQHLLAGRDGTIRRFPHQGVATSLRRTREIR
ncbi:SUMO protein smt3 [Vermiconidia calcicola]|uniref:SUMO protein smt3 n=1 Tax=Vermiconidia calcicola TaxID=1690605 RepID=A0ACC3NGG1_9PEZI|nr:SUMO protein smt3 [Vermiconidia calcicola]